MGFRRNIAVAVLAMTGCTVGAATVFEADGSSMDGWDIQWHSTTNAETLAPVWSSDGRAIEGAAFYSRYYDEVLGGVMYHTNGFSVAVGEVVTFSADFEGQGITAPDNRNHWWFSFGFRTGGTYPWVTGDIAAYATMRMGLGADEPEGFSIWNNWSDVWADPQSFCAIPSDEDYRSDVVTITFSVERTTEGFSPSILITSNHTTGARCVATGLIPQVNRNQSAAGKLYFFCEIVPEFDGPGGFSTVGSSVRFSNLKLTVGEEPPRPQEGGEALNGTPSEPDPSIMERIQDVKWLSNAEAESGYSARLSGQVLNVHPGKRRMFIHNGTAGIYVHLDRPSAEIEGLKIGSVVRIEGKTFSGGYSPIVQASKVDVIGWKPLPRPLRLDQKLFRSTTVDVEWVEVEGRPVSLAYAESSGHYMITMELLESSDTVESTIRILVPYGDDVQEEMKRYMYHRVRVPGVLATVSNGRQQMTGRILYINSLADFRLISGFPGTISRYVPMHELMQYEKESQGLVKTRGTVVGTTLDTLYLRGDKSNLKASIYQERELTPGDQVELTGYVHANPISPAFRTVSISRLEAGEPPVAREILLREGESDLDWNYDLVSLNVEFLHIERAFSNQHMQPDLNGYSEAIKETLWCRTGERIIEARLPEALSAPEGLRPGSLIRLTGICHIEETKSPGLDQMPVSLWLELSGPSAIAIVRAASWWSTQRLVWTLALSIILLLFFLLWVLLLHKVVARQTQTIAEQIQMETTLNERQRIARELHDTLDQGITALSLQLRRLLNKMRSNASDDLPILEKAMKTLQVCREESRASIQDLRSRELEAMDLPETIRHILDRYLEAGEVRLEMQVEGDHTPLTLFAKHQLTRIVSEAVGNAVKHAEPDAVHVHLSYDDQCVHVEVRDDGRGFDPSALNETDRFGVLGMRERVKRLNGTLDIASGIGRGTCVTITIPMNKFIKEASS